jgi:uncharacterized membrane protein
MDITNFIDSPKSADPAAASSSVASESSTKLRLESIDLLRGIVMIIMALDHVRDFFMPTNFAPTDLDQTWAALFFTRWITHFCAPVFVFLAGTSAYLMWAKGKSPAALSKFLLTRGIWLVFLEITVVRFGWLLNLNFQDTTLQVIWAIGWSMVTLAALVHLPLWLIATFGFANVFLHNLLDKVVVDNPGLTKVLWTILHKEGSIDLSANTHFYVAYPLIPWIGVIALGYVFGQVFSQSATDRYKTLLYIGLATIATFVILRFTNLYGDPDSWEVQKNGLYTFLSFINCAKYPPSLLYLLMTLGPAITLLAFLERPLGAITTPFITFGRVPLFYYILHLPLIRGLAFINGYWQLGHFQWKLLPWEAPANIPIPPEYGYNLPGVYIVWISIILILWPGCRWFAAVKQRSRNPWLSYL